MPHSPVHEKIFGPSGRPNDRLSNRWRIRYDVAVVGYDNWEVLAADCRPPLTTVDLDLERRRGRVPAGGPGRQSPGRGHPPARSPRGPRVHRPSSAPGVRDAPHAC
ncbi:hypothetical protein GCM10009682_12470 [Luedemannella flava]|uniref:Uncharacterized protein n=1 Tax=Luedemannella flava TaxID=349316 RepID=A0ABN2LLL1_9ACTN